LHFQQSACKFSGSSVPPSQKVPFEIICLADAVRSPHVNRAYLVLGGDGWTLRDYYTSGALADHLIHAALVRVVTLEVFIRLANNGRL
jgi:hypothetical protein